jgi:hypothetical protein
MEFFDKKQDVINLKLTRFGRQLLSIGEFEPVYYTFSDDGVMYDTRWISGSTVAESQWLVEQRIQEQTPRLETINSKVGADRTVFNTGDLAAYALDKNLKDLFNLGEDLQDIQELAEYKSGKLKIDEDFAESEKLLANFLGTKRYFNNKAPNWNVLYYNGILSGTSKSYQKNGVVAPIPQLDSTLKDTVYKVPPEENIFETEPSLAKISEITLAPDAPDIDIYAPGYTGQDGAIFEHMAAYEELIFELGLPTGSIVVEKDYLFISLEEGNVDFENENFLLEVYEITETDDLQGIQKMVFYGPSGLIMGENLATDAVESVFDVQVDTEIDRGLACYNINNKRKLKTKNIYTTDVFECDDLAIVDQQQGNPYNLPPVDAEDVC